MYFLGALSTSYRTIAATLHKPLRQTGGGYVKTLCYEAEDHRRPPRPSDSRPTLAVEEKCKWREVLDMTMLDRVYHS